MGNKCSTATETCGYTCTGYDGSHRWKQIHEIVQGIECDTCRDHAVKDMSAFHDIVNAGLGEELYDPNNLHRFVKQVNCVYERCVSEGKCKPL